MKPRSYTKALDQLLLPMGFKRQKREWVRVRDDMQERLDLQKSSIDGSVTVNLWAKDLRTEEMLKAIPCEPMLGIVQIGQRIGALIDGRDRWWNKDSSGSSELADAVRTYGVPWFDRVRSLDDQAAKWYGRGTDRPWRLANLAALAVTLYRLGEIDEALALFDAPVPKTAIPSLVSKGRCVQRWLESQRRNN